MTLSSCYHFIFFHVCLNACSSHIHAVFNKGIHTCLCFIFIVKSQFLYNCKKYYGMTFSSVCRHNGFFAITSVKIFKAMHGTELRLVLVLCIVALPVSK